MDTPSTYALRLSDTELDRYAQMAAHARDREGAMWREAGIIQGAHVADIGCGPGAVLVELATIVGLAGTVVGVEPDASTRATARTVLDARSLAAVDVSDGTGAATGLDPGRWDCVMVRHVLSHVGTAAGSIVEHLVTLLAPGGHLYLVDTDTDSFRLSVDDAEMNDQLQRYAEFHRHVGNDTRLGSHLTSMVRDAGLDVVTSQVTFDRFDASIVRDGWPLQAVQDAMIAAGRLGTDELAHLASVRTRFAQRPGSAVEIPMHIVIGRRR